MGASRPTAPYSRSRGDGQRLEIRTKRAWVTRGGSMSEDEGASRSSSPSRKGGSTRRLLVGCSTVLLSAGLAMSVAVAGAQAEGGSQTLGISQGSIATHPYADVSEGPSPGYSQVVDDATKGRFGAPGWRERPGGGQGSFGATYALTSQYDAPARFKVTIPATGYYTVYAWWPAAAGNSAAARFGVKTTSGIEWTTVNQQEGGGMWVRLGAYEMVAGDYYAVQVSQGSGGYGEAVADAVQVLSGEQANPEETAGAAEVEAAGGETIEAAAGKTAGSKVVRRARTHLGTRYRLSPPARCDAYRKEDCSCHTKVVFRSFGKRLPDNLVGQWNKGRRVRASQPRPGDLVFFDENLNGKLRPMDHVGIYSGNGSFIHASAYFGEVVETKMKRVDGYWGARRF
jgi:cell wall-associated NlpC family hydrolase